MRIGYMFSETCWLHIDTQLALGHGRKSVARQEAAVRRIGLQAIPWMDQPALAPVGSVFCGHTPEVAAGRLIRLRFDRRQVGKWPMSWPILTVWPGAMWGNHSTFFPVSKMTVEPMLKRPISAPLDIFLRVWL